MYICICNEVTDKDIKHASNLGACSIKDLRHSLNLGASCGKCSNHAQGLLDEYLSPTTELVAQTR